MLRIAPMARRSHLRWKQSVASVGEAWPRVPMFLQRADPAILECQWRVRRNPPI